MKIKVAGAVFGVLAATLAVAPMAPAQAAKRSASTASVARVVQVDLGSTKLVKIDARVTRRQAGSPVKLQVLRSSGWKTLDAARTNRYGRVKLDGRVGEGGFTLRVYAPPTRKAGSAVSRRVAVSNPKPNVPVVEPEVDNTVYTLEESRAIILDRINAYRAKYGVGPVALDLNGSAGAQAQIDDYARSGRHDLPSIVEYVNKATGEYPDWSAIDGCYGGSEGPTKAFNMDFRVDEYLRASQTHIVIGMLRMPNGDVNGMPYALSFYLTSPN